MSKSTFETEKALETVFDNLASLILAAILFFTGLGLSNPLSFTVPTVASYLTLGTLLFQFIAGLLVVAAFTIAYARKPLKTSIAGLVRDARAVAIAGALWTIGMLLVGLGNANGFTLVGIIANLAGYALLLASLVLSGTLGAHIASSKTV